MLQLTSPTEEEGALANATGGGMGGLPGGILPVHSSLKSFRPRSYSVRLVRCDDTVHNYVIMAETWQQYLID